MNIRDAIRLNDHVRIRNGSPGTKSGEREKHKYKTLDVQPNTTTADGRRDPKVSFDKEMEEKGIMSEIKDLSRFNYVLVTRSSPTHLDQESFMNEMVERMSSGKKSINQKSRASGDLIFTPAP